MTWKKIIISMVVTFAVMFILIVIGIKCFTETQTQYPEICWAFLLSGVAIGIIGVLLMLVPILRKIYT